MFVVSVSPFPDASPPRGCKLIDEGDEEEDDLPSALLILSWHGAITVWAINNLIGTGVECLLHESVALL